MSRIERKNGRKSLLQYMYDAKSFFHQIQNCNPEFTHLDISPHLKVFDEAAKDNQIGEGL